MNERHPKKILCQGQYVALAARGRWEFSERRKVSGIVAMIAITDDEELVLVEQYRPPVDRSVIELPAGLVGDLPGSEDEGLEVAAKRELIEETGYDPGKLEYLFTGVPSAGMTNEELTFYLATELRKVGDGGGDETEDITVHKVPVSEVHAWLQEQSKRGAAIDAKIYSGLYFCLNRRG